MKEIKKTDVVLSLSHRDTDGVCCAICLANVFPNISFVSVPFGKMVDDEMISIKYNLYDHIFITDVHPQDLSLLNYNDKIIYLDHHGSAMEAHNPNKIHFIDVDQSAASLTKSFLENYFNIDLSHLNDLVEISQDYDLWINKDQRGFQLNILYGYYRYDEFRTRFMKGNVNFTQDELDYIELKQNQYVDMFENIEATEFEKTNTMIITNTDEFPNEICHDAMAKYKLDVIFLRNKKTGKISVRHRSSDQNLHLGNILGELNMGGGHQKSAGMTATDQASQMSALKKLDIYLSTNFPNLKRK